LSYSCSNFLTPPPSLLGPELGGVAPERLQIKSVAK
jgi:hypothetical protein